MNQNLSGPSFPTLVQDFFCQYLIAQRNASKQTVAGYRDTFRLFLTSIQQRTGKAPSTLLLTDVNATLVLAFLDHLEQNRGNSVRTRNNRLAAIRTFMRYASHRDPTCLTSVQQVLAIPMKRFDRPMLDFLSRQEIQAIIDAPDTSTWSGHRDFVLFTTLYNTGARVSEIINLRVGHVKLAYGPCLHIHGKGRKQRAVPLWKSTAARLKEWLTRIETPPQTPVFPNRMGKAMSRSGVEDRLQVAVQKAQNLCPSLKNRRVSPHTLRHTTAMHLLQSGVDITVIALWLGHESPVTTHGYIEADLTMKEQALAKVHQPSTKTIRYRPTKDILAFLESL